MASGKSTFENTPGDFGGGFAGDVAEDGDAATLGLDDGAFFGGELIHGIIATLDLDVGLVDLQDTCGAEVVEDEDSVH